MALTLYDNPSSSNALKVRYLLTELDADFELSNVDMARPRPQHYVALNPLTGIPTLVDGDFVLTESHAILRYLSDREGRDDLRGADPRERATIDEFLDRFATRLRSPLFAVEAAALGWELESGFDPARGDAAKAREAEAGVQANLELLDSLVGPDFVVLGRLTIADCALAPILYRTHGTGMSLENFPNLLSLRDRLLSRPGWAEAAAGGV